MTHDSHLVAFWQLRLVLALEHVGHIGQLIVAESVLRKRIASASLTRELENQISI
jgi:hypothetical protein